MNNQKNQKILEQTKKIYNAIAPDFSDTRGKWWQPPFELKEELKDGMSVLDLGCGNGRFAELFRGRNIEYLGVDNSEEFIKICQERFAGESNIKFEVGDALDFSKLNKKFDLVLMIAVLHHLPSRELRLKVLQNIFNILNDGGKLIMRNWNLWNLKTAKKYYKCLFDLPYKISRGVWDLNDAFIAWKPLGTDDLRYVHSFKKGEMRRLLKKSGFSQFKQYYETYDNNQPVSILGGYNLVSVAVKKNCKK